MLCDHVKDAETVETKELLLTHFDLPYGVIDSMGRRCFTKIFAVCDPYGFEELKGPEQPIRFFKKIEDIIFFHVEPELWNMKMGEGLLLLKSRKLDLVTQPVTHILVYDRSLKYFHRPQLTLYTLPVGKMLKNMLKEYQAKKTGGPQEEVPILDKILV